jgi:hypothetical protein
LSSALEITGSSPGRGIGKTRKRAFFPEEPDDLPLANDQQGKKSPIDQSSNTDLFSDSIGHYNWTIGTVLRQNRIIT